MKKIFLIFFLSAFCLELNAQSLTFNDLLSMMEMKGVEQFVKSKGFIKTGEDDMFQYFGKNAKTRQSEKLIFYKKYKASDYTCHDVAFVKATLEQVRKSYRLMRKEPGKDFCDYIFTDGKLEMTVGVATAGEPIGGFLIKPLGAY